MTLINEGASRLKFLIESGMERASLVLAAQSITDSLQDMAEKLAKIESSDVMPMMDSMKENFGAEVATRFEQTVSEKLRGMSEALRSARDSIGNEILRMEASVNGEPVSDMAMDDITNSAASDDAAPMDMSAAPEGDAPAVDDGMDAPVDGDAPAADADAGEDEDFSSLFGDAPAAAAPMGRARKESVESEGVKALRESADPDAMIVRTMKRHLSEGTATKDAVRMVAEHFEIDADDVIDAVLESRKGK